MNSTLQCLLHIPELNNYFIKIYPKQKDLFKNINKNLNTKDTLSQEYYQIVNFINNNLSNAEKNITNNNLIPSINYLLCELKQKSISKFESNYSEDLFTYLIKSMHKDLNYFGDKKLEKIPKVNRLIEKESFNYFMTVYNNLNLSIFSYLFYGVLKNSYVCSSCQSKYYFFNVFHYLDLQLNNYHHKTFNIYQGLKDLFKNPNLANEIQINCNKCNKDLKPFIMKSEIYYTPPYLILNLNYGKYRVYRPHKIEFDNAINL